jgi:hypothetical protein
LVKHIVTTRRVSGITFIRYTQSQNAWNSKYVCEQETKQTSSSYQSYLFFQSTTENSSFFLLDFLYFFIFCHWIWYVRFYKPVFMPMSDCPSVCPSVRFTCRALTVYFMVKFRIFIPELWDFIHQIVGDFSYVAL